MKELAYRLITSLFLITALYYSYIYDNFFIFLIGIIMTISLFEYSKLVFKIKKFKKNKDFYLIFGICYLILAFFIMYFQIKNLKDVVFYFILICIATDVGGLFFGKIIKGKKLTKISPKKTYAGFYGSFFSSFLIMFLLIKYLDINYFIITLLTFSVCLLSQLGDLFFSFLKRQAKVKDTGNLLPGHGGILDRVDGIIISVPINLLIYSLAQ